MGSQPSSEEFFGEFFNPCTPPRSQKDTTDRASAIHLGPAGTDLKTLQVVMGHAHLSITTDLFPTHAGWGLFGIPWGGTKYPIRVP